MKVYDNIHEYIKAQEAAFDEDIYPIEGWACNFKKHIKLTTLYKNSQTSESNDGFTPINNIMRPLLMLQYFASGFDVKDILLYIDDAKKYFKSMLVRKYHELWALENGIDTVIDEMVESYVDFGLALLKDVDDVKPEAVPLQSLAFCDQTNILSGPIGIKHFYSPDQLKAMESKGWGSKKNGADMTIDDLLVLAQDTRVVNQSQGQSSKTPGKYAEVYEVHGQFPKSFLTGRYEDETYIGQMHIVAFYQGEGNGNYVTLFRGKEAKLPFKAIKRDPIFGRAWGFGGGEELFEAQVWTTYDLKRLQDMLNSASKTILGAIGQNSTTIATRSKMRDLENNEILDLGEGDLKQIDTFPRNARLFEQSINDWQARAQMISGTPNPLLGQEPSAGTPFKLQDLVTQTGKGPHDYRKGKLATFWNEVERDWILPHLTKELTQDQEFLAELDLKDLQYVSDSLVECETQRFVKEKILKGETLTQEEVDLFKTITLDSFKKGGNKHFFKIFKGEMKDVPLVVKTNVAGKQKNLAANVDKITNIFRFVFSNPQGFMQVMQIPGMSDAFNNILEFSGLEPADFSGVAKLQEQMEPQPSPIQPKQPEPAY